MNAGGASSPDRAPARPPSLARRLVLALVAAGLLAGETTVAAQPAVAVVYVAPIEGIIDLGLAPFVERFLLSLRDTARARRASGAPVSGQRRAVTAAIDRVCEAFLAIDVESGAIADANPAAGALLGTTRDRLLGADAMSFVPE